MAGEISLIPRSFYSGMNAVSIAKKVLGTILYTEIIPGKITTGRIVEVEAYMAPEDLACHARGNRRTARTETMFAEPGTAYVYKCYGIHNLFNIVTAPEDVAHAILIRAIEPLKGIDLMSIRRKLDQEKVELVNGPGKLTTALGISTVHNGIDLASESSPIKIFKDDEVPDIKVIAGPRVGMSHHTRHCGYYPWRFRVSGNRYTSLPREVKYDW
jgi:DNA-3-methyladenine glycosylase